METPSLSPWIPPSEPDPFRLALEAADEAGLATVDAWPAFEKAGVVFGGLHPFLCWRGGDHLVLVQARELGALVPGAQVRPLPEGWLEALDLPALARPLARHPDFPGGAAVHVARVEAPGRARCRTWGAPGAGIVEAVLERLSGIPGWEVEAGD
ncbi:MAG TPA: hypothetical protein VK188_04855 [Holophaga sp.]|nr:hypothetical protein [Holophaga sp.]